MERNEVEEGLAAQEQQQRAQLIDAARERVPVLRNRPFDHPTLIGAAVSILMERGRYETTQCRSHSKTDGGAA